MGLSRTVSEINGDFGRRSQFSHPIVFNIPTKLVVIGILCAMGLQKARVMPLYTR